MYDREPSVIAERLVGWLVYPAGVHPDSWLRSCWVLTLPALDQIRITRLDYLSLLTEFMTVRN